MNIHDISWEAEVPLELVSESVQNALNEKKLFRYQFKHLDSYVNILEQGVRNYVGTDYALGVSSATNAIFLALKAVGVSNDSKVLIPSFTFTAVPSAVIQCGAVPVLVDITYDLVIDLIDLESKIISSESKFLLLSHMRGHLCDMDEVVRICDKHGVVLVEDAAHALGVKWKGKHAGTFGVAGVYSLQSYKIVNAGEGGLLVTNDPDIFWQSVFMSGSYESNYKLHSKSQTKVAEKYLNKLPVFNVRMNNITAALAIPQLNKIESTILSINKNYLDFISKLESFNNITLPAISINTRPVRDSVQMHINLPDYLREELKTNLIESSIPISYFGGVNNLNARLYTNWDFLDLTQCKLPNTEDCLKDVFDLRLPIHFDLHDIQIISDAFFSIFSHTCNKNVNQEGPRST